MRNLVLLSTSLIALASSRPFSQPAWLRLRGGADASGGAAAKASALRNIPTLTLETADAMSSAALREAARIGLEAPLAVVVVDAAGRVLVSKRQNRCANLFPTIAAAKAQTCVNLAMSSRALQKKYVPERATQVLAMTSIAGGELVPFPGGVVCVFIDENGERRVVGAIGVSGAAGDEDEHCAIVAVQSVDGVTAEPASSALPAERTQ